MPNPRFPSTGPQAKRARPKPAALLEPTRAVRAVGFSPRARHAELRTPYSGALKGRHRFLYENGGGLGVSSPVDTL